MKSASIVRAIVVRLILYGIPVISMIGLLLSLSIRTPPHGPIRIKSEIVQLACALETCRVELGDGEYPPGSTDDLATVKRFLATAFPEYNGELPEKYKSLNAAYSLVFWLGGVTDKDGKMIGFSRDRKNPFDTTNKARIGPFYEFDPLRLRNENGLSVYLPRNDNPRSDPFVYFRPDSKGEYHGACENCRPCRDSVGGGWVCPKSFQLFAPGMDGKYGCGVQYPSGTDYDAQRKDDLSNFTGAATLDNDMPLGDRRDLPHE